MAVLDFFLAWGKLIFLVRSGVESAANFNA
jgi:hypothetical protein